MKKQIMAVRMMHGHYLLSSIRIIVTLIFVYTPP